MPQPLFQSVPCPLSVNHSGNQLSLETSALIPNYNNDEHHESPPNPGHEPMRCRLTNCQPDSLRMISISWIGLAVHISVTSNAYDNDPVV
jgi:hypothetical protein